MNSISNRKKVIQRIITVCLLIALLWGISNARIKLGDGDVNNANEANSDARRYESVLESQLVYGEYGACVDFYVTASCLNEEEMSEPKYDRFREFIEFYEAYMGYVKCTAFDEQYGSDKYANEGLLCIEKMQEISANSQFKENAPYYQDILNKVNGE